METEGSVSALQGQEYKNYEASFKKHLLVRLASDAVWILISLLAFFVPIFKIEILGLTEKFSFYDEIEIMIKNFSLTNIFSVYSLVLVVPIIIAQVVRLIKDILSLISFDLYLVEKYKKIKNCTTEKKPKKNSMFLGFMVFAIVIAVAYASKWIRKNMSSLIDSSVESYFEFFNGFSPLFYLVLVITVASVVLDAYELIIKNSLKKKILLEE